MLVDVRNSPFFKSAESAGMSNLIAQYNNVLTKSQAAIVGILGHRSFLQGNTAFRAKVVDSHHDEAAGAANLKNIEGKRQSAENSLFSQGAAELAEIGKIVVGEFSKSLTARRRGFLQAPINIRLTKCSLIPS